ncbi:hypothetical protein ABUP50_002411 [Cronobacter malonaticus]|uniref:hypothetical protein n=1 Tax=Cronobacter malonaticus TaxID=413503 RepID=UPI001375BE0A|nr:hypothetical protein [Cronobacter malonaticus]MDT3566233.1 hypothetical protein [Cronobacter malonaticus]NCH84610.1 hypothetical protein [Cronobacter malonaticus]
MSRTQTSLNSYNDSPAAAASPRLPCVKKQIKSMKINDFYRGTLMALIQPGLNKTAEVYDED